MRYIDPSYDLASAAGTDAANARMRAEGRAKWNRLDRNEAVRVMNRILGEDETRCHAPMASYSMRAQR